MEIKIKNNVVLKPAFLDAIQRLLQSRPMPARTSIEVNRAIDEIVSHHNIVKRSRRDVTLRYCSKKEDGSAVVNEQNNVVFPDEVSEKTCKEALDEIDKESITFELTTPVVIYDDENITPIELRLLGGIVEVKERPKT